MRRAHIFFLLPVSALFAVFACTGSDPDATNTDERGAENQACFENNTCRGSLTCMNGLCVASVLDGAPAETRGPAPGDDAGDDAAIDAGDPCKRAGAYCDSFDTIGDWEDKNNGHGLALVDDFVAAHSAPKALYAAIGNVTDNARAEARRKRVVRLSGGAARWTTWVYIENVPPTEAPHQLLQLQYQDTASKYGGFALELAIDGFKFDIDNGEFVAPKSPRLKPNLHAWNELTIEFDVAARHVVAYVNGATNETLNGDNHLLVSDGATFDQVSLTIGISSDYGAKADVWMDDLQFIPK